MNQPPDKLFPGTGPDCSSGLRKKEFSNCIFQYFNIFVWLMRGSLFGGLKSNPGMNQNLSWIVWDDGREVLWTKQWLPLSPHSILSLYPSDIIPEYTEYINCHSDVHCHWGTEGADNKGKKCARARSGIMIPFWQSKYFLSIEILRNGTKYWHSTKMLVMNCLLLRQPNVSLIYV